MDSKLIDIKSDIKSNEKKFRIYLETNLDNEVLDILNKLEKEVSLYLFSGIIRDFFINPKSSFRDIDLVYETDNNVNIECFLGNYHYKKNSFGGYKIFTEHSVIDIWNLHETWGLKRGQLSFDFYSLYKLPDTTFFNFSSIIYSLNDNEFIIGEHFLKFMKGKTIDFVMEDNPFPELCIINSIYYKKKLNLKLSKKLKNYIIDKKETVSISNLLDAQNKHFNEILFKKEDIQDFFANLEK